MKPDKERPSGQGVSAEVEELRAQLLEANETLEAIRTGAVDALIVSCPEGSKVFSLHGAETPYRALVEQINEGALLLDCGGTILFANARFAELARTPLEQVPGSFWEAFFPPSERARLRQLLEEARSGGVRSEISLSDGCNPGRPVQLSIALLKGAVNDTFSVIVTDITERKCAEQALRQANESLEARVQQRTKELTRANESLRLEMAERRHAEELLQSQAKHLEALVEERTTKLQDSVFELEYFSYTITHDMRAPLRAMSGYAELLLEERHSLGSNARQYIEWIDDAARRMDRLILDALNYSRLVRQTFEMSAVDCVTMLKGMIETYPQYHRSKALITVEGDIPAVMGNEALLTQCFSNLLNNAIKFVQPGDTPMVQIFAEPKGDLVRICFQDNGIGIPEEFQEQVFLMFHTVRPSNEGTGIGLALVRKAAERMGGSVGVQSTVGKGSRFWLELKTAKLHHPNVKP